MLINAIISIAILALLWIAQFKARPLLSKKIKLIYTTVILAPAIPLAISSYTLYYIWLYSPAPIKYFLPPYTPISYYIFTIGRRFWIPYLIAVIISLIFLLLIHSIKKNRREKIFEKEEPYIITACIVLTGHPTWLAYILASLIIYLIVSISFKGERASLYYAWIPIAMLIILSTPLIFNLELLSLLKLSA